MSQLEFYLVLSGLWMAAAWVPYILERFVSRGIMGTFANPSPNLPEQSAWAQRARAAHKVGIETFAAFGPLAVYASLRTPDDGYLGTLAMAYFVGIFAHYVIYAIGIPVLRTLAFLLASLATIAMALHLLGWI